MAQTTGPAARAPGSFSPVVSQSLSSRPPIRRVESSSSDDNDDDDHKSSPLAVPKQRIPVVHNPSRSLYAASALANSSNSSLQNLNLSRPTIAHVRHEASTPLRDVSPLTIAAKIDFPGRGHARKHSQTQGSFEPYLPTAATSNLSSMANPNPGLSASQIAAQAAMQQQSQQHLRQRSQTVPGSQIGDGATNGSAARKPSKGGPTSPPLLSLTEASAPKEASFGGQVYHNGLLGGHTSAAQTAANVVFPKSPASSPGLSPTEYEQQTQPGKTISKEKEKSKVKLFSRPGKIGVSKDKEKEARAGALPSPSKMTFSLQRNNMSTNSLADSMSSATSMYSMANSSSATIRAIDQPETGKDGKGEKKHHFLSRQKHKLSSKDDHHLPLSSAASNSKPVDPSAPSSLYNFNLPASPAPSSTSFAKSMYGLDLRHGGRALREKKKEEKGDGSRESESLYQNNNDWPGPSSLGSAGGASYLGSSVGQTSIYGLETQDLGKYGLNNMTPDDAWPFLKAKLLITFEGEDLRLPVEDFNRLVLSVPSLPSPDVTY